MREPPSIAVTERSRRDVSRLRVLLTILVLSAVVYGVALPYLRSLKSRPAAPSAPRATRSEMLLSGGMESAEQRRWLEAVEMLDAASRSGADTATTHRALGRCLGELGWIPDTIAEYQKAIQQEPAFFDTYISLATAYRSLGKRADALRALDRAVAVLQNGSYNVAPARYARPAAPMLEALAEAYARVGDFPRSVDWATQAVTADPTRPQGYELAAKDYFVLKQSDKAIPLLQKACSYAPNDPDAHYTLALALRSRPSEPHNVSARQHLLNAIKLDPNHAPALTLYGQLCMERKEWDAALIAFEAAYGLRYEPGTLLWQAAQASKAKGDRMQTAFFLGQYYEYVGQLPTALQYFQTLLADPKRASMARILAAGTLTKMGRYTDAVAGLEKAISLDPRSPALRRQLADIYDKMNVVARRIAALNEAAKLDPQHADQDYYRLGRIAFNVGKYDEAEQLLEKSITLNSNVSQYHYSLAQTYLLRPDLGDRLNKAIHQLEEAERLTPDDVSVHDLLSTAYIKAQDWANAARALHRSADTAPQNEVLYFRLNQVYRRLGNEQEAKRVQDFYQRLRKQEVEKDLLSRRAKAHPRDPAALVAFGDLFIRQQDFGNARREFEKALDLTPNDPSIHERLSVVYGELALPEGQWQHLQQVKRLTGQSR